ncbi:hypothetical protein SBOR_6817 [Sclerotinia borealis F-4128]|uniref:RRM domain-containing protein n=1 Tax=Sclerotinia borealis (strain F-4128) TaxID=1432307 RepID=W9CAF3_SCLBF|nr:hypothetical protein SBOR_6817 [Sclerotinia borealis F-4128]
MGKRSRNDSTNGGEKIKVKESAGKLFLTEGKAVDPTLALLFASSAGPVQAPSNSRYQEAPPARHRDVETQDGESPDESDDEDAEDLEMGEDDDDLSSVDGDLEDVEISDLSDEDNSPNEIPELDTYIAAKTEKPERKRKRKTDEPDLEGKYLQKLAREEEKEEEERQAERRLKRQKLAAEQNPAVEEDVEEAGSDDDMEDAESDEEAESEDGAEESDSKEESLKRKTPSDAPLHESLVPDNDATELEKASRTIFLGNVASSTISSKADKKILMSHLSSFIDDLPVPQSAKPSHKLESLRFRSTAYATSALPKKAAFAKKDIMTATTKSTNAYAVYSTPFAAREAVKKLNGTMVLDRHLRVDGVAHPAKTDHRRCVFVGNLGFVDDESLLEQDGENSRKRSRIPSDIEEGLWRQFGKAGEVESVRVIRDEKTRVGKGFAYVQFTDANAVESALLFNEKKYPPMLPRPLRVVRAKAQHKQVSSRPIARQPKSSNSSQIYNPKIDSNQASLQGRATKLLGKAGGAKFKKTGANDTTLGTKGDNQVSGNGEVKSGMAGIKAPESFVFEGYRASASKGKPKDLKLGGKGGGKKKSNIRSRSSNRGAEWKKRGSNFAFVGDDIEIDSTQEAPPPNSHHAAETGTLATRKSSGAFPVAGQPLLPPTYHTVEELLKTLPSQIAYSTLVVKLDDGREIRIPRRELWDVRAQLMAEDEGDGEGLMGLGNDDVKTGVYEGGFKSWESSVDLVKVLGGRAAMGEGRRRVLELGCGTALPSLAVFQWFLENTTTSTSTSTSGLELGLADYNPTVLQLVTLPNVLLSWAQITKPELWEAEGELDIDEALISEFISALNTRNIDLSFFSGAWSQDLVSLVTDKLHLSCENTIMIGAETIYSPVALRAFAETLMALLELSTGPNKIALIGAKKVYFGVGGSIEDFVTDVTARGALVEQVREESDGVRRAVIEDRMMKKHLRIDGQLDISCGARKGTGQDGGLEKVLGTRPVLSGGPSDIKGQFDALITALAAQRGSPDISVQTRDASAEGVPVRIYTPPNPSGTKLPLGVYYHGGGYCVGDLDSEDVWCRYIAKNTPCIIVSVDYRLGPKHKLPVMLDDSVTAYEWAYDHSSELGADPTQTFTIGASAGGGLALTVANDLIAAGKRNHIQGIVAMVPVAAHPTSVPAAYKLHYQSYNENAADVPIINLETMDTFFAAVDADFHDPRTFVTLSQHLSSFPPTYIATCGKDPLRDDGKVLEMMLKDKGIPTKSNHYDGVPHFFWLFPGIKGGEDVLANVCEGVRFVLGA